jgi:thiopeptide-type bacteriocin biosynthesis protein
MIAPFPGRVPEAFEWTYYKLYIGASYDALDFVITDCMEDAIQRFGEHGWFFLRYLDEGGLHLRVRFRLKKSTLTETEPELFAALHGGLSLLSQRLLNTYTPLLTFGGIAVDPPQQVLGATCLRCEYEPEFDTYGGEIGVAIAEQVFCISSVLAREILRKEASAELSRKNCALPLYIEAIDTFVADREVNGFLERYVNFWLSGDAALGAHKSAFIEKAYNMIDEGITILTPVAEYPLAVAELASQWKAALVSARERYERQCPAYSKGLADTLAFYFVHLMNNRLGFNTVEESYLAILLSTTYENGYQYAAS